jgi:hypothetical protein
MTEMDGATESLTVADLADELGADLAPRLLRHAYHVGLDGRPVILGYHAEAGLADLAGEGER